MKLAPLFLFLTSFSLCSQIPVLSEKNIKIEKLNQLNSRYRETNLCISPNGKYLLFMSDRGGQPWSTSAGTFRGNKRYDGDIWMSEKINGKWQKPECLPINTGTGEDEPNISPDGQTVYFQSWRFWWEDTGGPYYKSTLYNQKWGIAIGLGGGINKFFVDQSDAHPYSSIGTDGMSISPDGKIFIVAYGVDYDGNMDLYISHFTSNGWTYLKRMNTPRFYDDRSVFIASDNKTVFFASDRPGGFGGLDIYRAELVNDRLTNIVNIGEPFNTSADDYSFIITADGKEAFFVRNGDIYHASLPENNSIASNNTLLINGVLTQCNGKPLETLLTLTDENGNVLASSKSSFDGKFSFSVEFKAGDYFIVDDQNKKLTQITVTDQSGKNLEINISRCNGKDLPKAAQKH